MMNKAFVAATPLGPIGTFQPISMSLSRTFLARLSVKLCILPTQRSDAGVRRAGLSAAM